MSFLARTTWVALTVLLLAGCGASANLQRKLESRSGELLYLHDTVKVTEKQEGSLKIGSFVVDDVLIPSTEVKEKSGFVVPLVFVNFWKYDYEGRLGSAQIGNDYKKFIRESFIEELKRSGKFRYVEQNGDMEIDIKVKTIEMFAPIRKNGNFLFLLIVFSYGQSTSAGPVDVVITADVTLRKEGKELLNKAFQGRHRTGPLNANYNTEDNLLKDYQTAMIEAVSLAVKNLNENIIGEINKL